MKPLKLTLVTLCCTFVLAAAPYGVKKLFPAGDSANTVVLTELPASAPATPVEAPMAAVGHRAPSVMAALPSPQNLSGASIASGEPTPVRRESTVAEAAKPVKIPLTFDKDVKRAQELMKQLGNSDMGVDGKLGPKTLASLNSFRKSAGLIESAVLDASTLSALEQKFAQAESAKKASESKPELIAPELKSSGVVVELAANERILPAIAKAPPVAPRNNAHVEVVQPEPAFAGATVTAPGSLLNKGEQSNDHTLAAPEGMFAQAKVAAAAEPQLSELPTVKNASEGVVKNSVEVASAGKLTVGSHGDGSELAVSQPAPTVVEVAPVEKPEVAPETSVVVKVNADAGSPQPDPMATPVAVGTAVVEQTPDVTRVPQAVLPAMGTDGERNAALEKELAEAQTRIAMVTKDSRYEAGKFATTNIATVNELASQVRNDLDRSVKPADVQQNLVKLSSDLEVAKGVAQKKKAEELTAKVEAAYKVLTGRFGEQARREPLSETMVRVDAGFEAMKSDLKKGNYDPIVQRCEGFKESIDKLTESAARLYVADQLADKMVLAELDKSELKEIDGLKSDGKFVKAADKILGSLDESESDSKKSDSVKSDSKKSDSVKSDSKKSDSVKSDTKKSTSKKSSASKSTSKKSSTSEKSAKGGASGSKSS